MNKYTQERRIDPRTVFTTLEGTQIHFVPFSWDEYLLSQEGLRQEYRERGEIVDCPRYKVTYMGGTSQWFDHDAKSIEQAPPETPPEDVERIIAEQKETWMKYQDALARFTSEDNDLRVDFIYSDSLAEIKLPEDNEWEIRQQKRRVKIPTDPEEKRRHYINTVLCKARGDQVDMMATIIAISMGATKEEDVLHVVESFRNIVWGKTWAHFGDALVTAQEEQPGGVEQPAALRPPESS